MEKDEQLFRKGWLGLKIKEKSFRHFNERFNWFKIDQKNLALNLRIKNK